MKDEELADSQSNSEWSEAAWSDSRMLSNDQELNDLLLRWNVPAVPSSLDRNLLIAFRRQASQSTVSNISVHNSLPGLSLLSTEEVKTMKQCNTCMEEFAGKFIFCPIDGTLLSETTIEQASLLESNNEPIVSLDGQGESAFPFVSRAAYHLTIIEDKGLGHRLLTELSQAARQSRLTWPEFKLDPIGFSRRSMRAYSTMTWRFFSSPNVAIASLVAILIMMTTVIGLVLLDRHRAQQELALADKRHEDVEFLGLVDIPDAQKPDEGAPGLNKGNGGGSKPNQERPGGGGGGGLNEQLAASQGKVPQGSLELPLLAPDPKTPPLKNPALPTPVTIQADPMLFPPDGRPIPYGDPKSNSTELSSGQGSGDGIGTGSGAGVGSGDGRGYGPGSGFNTGGGPGKVGGGGTGGPDGEGGLNRIFKPTEVTQKARILSKPIPEYTEEARRNQITGTVVLQMVFSSSGSVTSIRTISGLPFGLTEKAVAAARRIQFSPATKDGRAVSQYIRVEYNFNIY